jgi:NADH:ubiquinone oxidoreductase subunit 6 (subunit J)
MTFVKSISDDLATQLTLVGMVFTLLIALLKFHFKEIERKDETNRDVLISIIGIMHIGVILMLSVICSQHGGSKQCISFSWYLVVLSWITPAIFMVVLVILSMCLIFSGEKQELDDVQKSLIAQLQQLFEQYDSTTSVAEVHV